MYEIDPVTNQVIVGADGQPLQLLREPLSYNNNLLILSPGLDQDGPLQIGPPPVQYPLGRTLTPLSGRSPRYFTRRPVSINTSLPGPRQVTAQNARMVTFKMQGQIASFSQTSQGIWTEQNPEETAQFVEVGRDDSSVYLTRLDGAVNVQIDLHDGIIRVDGRNTHRIDSVN